MPSLTTCSVLFWASRATCSTRRLYICDERSRCSRSPPRRITTWASRSGTAARKKEAISELKESVRLDPAAGAGHAFLGNALRESGDLGAAHDRACNARSLFCRPFPPPISISAIVFLRSGDLDKALGQFEAGLNVPIPLPPAPDWDSCDRGPPRSAWPKRRPCRRAQHAGAPARPQRRGTKRGCRRGIPRSGSSAPRLRAGL